MQIPIINGSATDESANFRTIFPRNMIPVPKETGFSAGYLRPADGIVSLAVGPGTDRGGINWNGIHYRVMGETLVQISKEGSIITLGEIPGVDLVTLDYSFDYLIIVSSGKLFYYKTEVKGTTDPDFGNVIDAIWVDGYTMTTDGTSLIVTELGDPFSVNPLKYGSSEADPDPVVGLLKLRNEPYALNRYTIEQFDNIGGDLFPFQRNKGAQLQRGAMGTYCAAVFSNAIAFMGSGRNEAPAVWLGLNGSTSKISTREIDTIIAEYSEAQLSKCLVEARIFRTHEFLYVHLPDQTLVYDGNASQATQQPVWHILCSSTTGKARYRGWNMVFCYDMWMCGDPTTNNVGQLVDTVSTHYGDVVGWEFATQINYNGGMGAIFNMLELVTLPGRIPLGVNPVIWTSYSEDGETWSQEKSCYVGKQGERNKRVTWIRQGRMKNWRIQKFRGTSDAHLSVARLEAQLEPLSV